MAPAGPEREGHLDRADASGYLHPQFARSYAEFGEPRALAGCGGWLLERAIPGSTWRDTMGCYPLFACRDWTRLRDDIEALPNTLVSLTLVTDPFGEYDETCLRQCFPDLAVPFKQHYVIDLEKPRGPISRHHRRAVRNALRTLRVRHHPDPRPFLSDWMSLRDQMAARHEIRWTAALSRQGFEDQLATPGAVLLSASADGLPVAATLWFVHGATAYGHLLAYSEAGRQTGALYALIWTATDHFAGSVRWLDLMGVPGARDAGSEGIREFKAGWTTDTRTAWLCGRILNHDRYAELARLTGASAAEYFPAYRSGELA